MCKRPKILIKHPVAKKSSCKKASFYFLLEYFDSKIKPLQELSLKKGRNNSFISDLDFDLSIFILYWFVSVPMMLTLQKFYFQLEQSTPVD